MLRLLPVSRVGPPFGYFNFPESSVELWLNLRGQHFAWEREARFWSQLQDQFLLVFFLEEKRREEERREEERRGEERRGEK